MPTIYRWGFFVTFLSFQFFFLFWTQRKKKLSDKQKKLVRVLVNWSLVFSALGVLFDLVANRFVTEDKILREEFQAVDKKAIKENQKKERARQRLEEALKTTEQRTATPDNQTKLALEEEIIGLRKKYERIEQEYESLKGEYTNTQGNLQRELYEGTQIILIRDQLRE